jgi:spore coat protein U-like protein
MNMKLAGAFLLLWLGWLPQNSWALCVGCTCSVTRADNIAFGNYQPFSSSDIDVAGTVEVYCFVTLGVTASIDIMLSRGSSSSYLPRTMMSGSNPLNYNLYTNSSRTTIWGDGTGGTSIITRNFILGLLGSITLTDTVYARLPAGQTTAAVGSYSDTITLTVEY